MKHAATYPFDLSPLSEDETIKAQSEFRRIDKDGNGVLDANELTEYLATKPQLRCFPRLIVRIFGSDEDKIDWPQFYYSYRSFSANPNDDEHYIGRKIFDYIDSDHSGTMEAEEFNSVLDYIDIPQGNITPFLMQKGASLTYEGFKAKFYKLLTMIWRSCDFNGGQY